MTFSHSGLRQPSRRAWLVAGVALGLIVPLLAAEAFLRLRPPEDLIPYLGDELSQSGIYKPDPVLRVDYKSIDDYIPYETPPLRELEPLNSEQPTWLFFGNSFARGLSASVRPRLTTHRVLFFREAKDELHMRVAQFRLLLENGLKAERAFFTLIPIEAARYAVRPLDWVYVTRDGAISSKISHPGEPLDTLLERSWLARTAWVRSRLHLADPTFRMSSISETVPASVVEDFRTMFNALGEVSRQYRVPVTVVLLPDRRQILGDSSFALQNRLAELVRAAGLDAFDPAAAFLAAPDKRALYLPDWHYTGVGDKVLLDRLLAHLHDARVAGTTPSQ